MKRCFLVTGPESAGNRLLGQILVEAGCEGDAKTPQHAQLPSNADLAVVVRSFRHDGYDPASTIATLAGRGYRVTVLVPVRHPVALIGSQIQRGLAVDAADVMRHTRFGIIDVLTHTDAWLVPYESLEAGADALVRMLGLVPGRRIAENRNAKHYDRPPDALS